jgi:hypothetical protein
LAPNFQSQKLNIEAKFEAVKVLLPTFYYTVNFVVVPNAGIAVAAMRNAAVAALNHFKILQTI